MQYTTKEFAAKLGISENHAYGVLALMEKAGAVKKIGERAVAKGKGPMVYETHPLSRADLLHAMAEVLP